MIDLNSYSIEETLTFYKTFYKYYSLKIYKKI